MGNNKTNAEENRRRRYYCDPQVQGTLLRHAIGYWLGATAAFAFIVFVYRVVPSWMSNSKIEFQTLWFHFEPILIASLVFLPISLSGANRLSNRFAGPALRFRRVLQQLADGQTPEPIVLRQRDFWNETAESINQIIADRKATETAEAADEMHSDEPPVPCVGCGPAMDAPVVSTSH